MAQLTCNFDKKMYLDEGVNESRSPDASICDNCNCHLGLEAKVSIFEADNRNMTNEGDVQIWNAIAYIYGMDGVTEEKLKSSINTKGKMDTFSDGGLIDEPLGMCKLCASLLFDTYKAFKQFQSLTHQESLILQVQKSRGSKLENCNDAAKKSVITTANSLLESSSSDLAEENLFDSFNFEGDTTLSDEHENSFTKDYKYEQPDGFFETKSVHVQELHSTQSGQSQLPAITKMSPIFSKELVIEIERISEEDLEQYRKHKNRNNHTTNSLGKLKTKPNNDRQAKLLENSDLPSGGRNETDGLERTPPNGGKVCNRCNKDACSWDEIKKRNIFFQFWGANEDKDNYNRQSAMLASFIKWTVPAERTVKHEDNFRKKFTYHYSLPDENGVHHEVCFVTFLHVLQITVGRVITVQNKLVTGQTKFTDGRGLHRSRPRRHSEELKTCEICGRTMSAGYFKFHMQKHAEQQPWKCDTCDKKYFNKQRYQRHVLTHSENFTPYLCKHCGATLTDKYTFYLHERKHTEDKKFSCHVCSKKFFQESDLRIHLAVHSIERKFVCDECGNSYKRISQLNKHKKMHKDVAENGEYSFKCKYCSRLFKHSETLLKHIKGHENNFECSFCGQRLMNSPSLKRHENLHKTKPGLQARKQKKWKSHLPYQLINSTSPISASQQK